MSAVALERVTKHFGAVAAVDDLSFAIEPRQLVSLLGPSGCGKTTTLRLIAGFLPLDGGTITVGERVLSAPGRTAPPERRNMSMIFQSYALWPHMTVAGNVAYGLRLRKLARAEIERRVADILAVTRLGALAERYPGEISGGQQQRVALARALVVEPEILLMDEPLSNLDANLREEMRFEIRRLHDEYRTTTVYVTHDQIEAMTTADIIAVMNEGRLEQAGRPSEIFERPRSEFVARFIGGTNILKGRSAGGSLIESDGLMLRCGDGERAADGAAIVSIRPHHIGIAADSGGGMEANEARGMIARQVYLGVQRDYLVILANGQQLRVVTNPEIDLAVGSAVRLSLPPERCRALPR
jgi:iron(III) transport system ATP-binding protein